MGVSKVDAESTQFMNVDNEVIQKIGRSVIAGARLEGVVHDIALALALPRTKDGFKKVTRAVKERCSISGVPIWSTVGPASIIKWVERADTYMDQRNQLFHSFTAAKMQADGLKTIQISIRDRAETFLDITKIEKLVESLVAMTKEGTELERRLLPEMLSGVHVRYFPDNEPAGRIIYHGDDASKERPDDKLFESFIASLDATYRTSGVPFSTAFPST